MDSSTSVASVPASSIAAGVPSGVSAAPNDGPAEQGRASAIHPTATAKERFDVLHGALERYYAGFFDAALKVIASLVVALGWLITSDGAARLFDENLLARVLATTGLAFSAGIYAVTAKRLERNSARVGRSLDALGYMPNEYYRDRIVTWKVTLPYVITNAVFNAFLAALVWIITPKAA